VLVIFSAVFILLIFLNYFFGKRDNFILIFDKHLDPYVGFFLLAFILSALFSVNPYFSYNGYYGRMFAMEQIIYVFLLYFFSSTFLQDLDKREMIISFTQIAGFTVSAYAIVQCLGWDFLHLQPQGDNRPISSLGNGVFLGGFLLLCFPFSFSKVIERRKLDFSLLSSIVMLIAIILSQTRTAYVGVLIEFLLIMFLFSYIKNDKGLNRGKLLRGLKNSFIVLGIILVLLATLVVFANDNVYVKRLFSISEIFENPRWLLWRDSFKILLAHPFTGSGVSTFPLVFEDVYSLQFKLLDVNSNYDNAHSNYVNILCTMGVIGIVAYLLVIIRSVLLALKSISSKVLNEAQKTRYIPFLAVIIGYVTYGLTEFDDLSIMLYLFVFLAILKSMYSEDNNLNLIYFPKSPAKFSKLTVAFLFLILISFLSYNVYRTIYKIQADRSFALANSNLSANDYQSSFDNYKNAIRLWNDNSYYHFQYGWVMLNYGSYYLNNTPTLKHEYLSNAKSKFEIAETNYASKRDCLGYIAISDYELGDTIEAEKIKNDLLSRDSLFVTFRSLLAAFYIKKGNFAPAMDQLLFICRYDRHSKALNNNIVDIINNKKCPGVKEFCQKILAIDPANENAMKYILTH